MAAHLLERRSGVRSRQNENGALAVLRNVDLLLLASTLVVSVLGSVSVYAATRMDFTFEPSYYLKRQVMFSVLGLIVMVSLAFIDYHRLEQWAYVIFGGVVLSLLAVFAVGKSTVTAGSGSTASGVAQRWINLGVFQLQPSEFAVIGLIAVLAFYLTKYREDLSVRRLVPLGAIIVVPLLLIVKQPDLGTSIVLIVVSFSMLLVGGVKTRFLLAALVLGAIGFVLAVQLHLVHSSEIQRLTSFLHPSQGAQSANYQVDLAKEAIGSGGFQGTGIFRGTFTNFSYVPEQSTDFIFATVGEQFGFVGSAVLIGLYGVMALRMLRAAQAARDGLGRLLCAGVLTFLVFSVFQNIGMNVGLMPVTGIPLPFVSYGGSAIVVFYAAIGLVLNVEMRRRRLR